MRDPSKTYHNEDGTIYEGEITVNMLVIEFYRGPDGKMIENVVLKDDDSPTLVG